MKKLLLLAVAAVAVYSQSCTKNVAAPLSYSVDTFANAYVNNNDTLDLPVRIKFLAGNTNEEMKLYMTGLPNNVSLIDDTLRGTPSFTAMFKVVADNATLGYYPVTLWISSKSTGVKSYPFTLGVVNNNCLSYFTGSLNGTNACSSANYSFTATATANADNSLNIVNFGGYGTNTSTKTTLDCNTGTISIPSQNIGNGVTVSGTGTFTTTKMTINYIALNTPGGFNDTCTVQLTR